MASLIPHAASVSPLQIAEWARVPWLVHGFSTREGGVSSSYRGKVGSGGESAPKLNLNLNFGQEVDLDLNLGFTASDAPENVRTNRARLLARLTGNGKDAQLVTLKQTHSSTIHRVDTRDAQPLSAPASLEGDGLITNTPGLMLGIQTADCVPVLLFDDRRRVVGAFHAGWRGTLGRIVENGVSRMEEAFGSEVRSLRAAIGPAVGACCYTVGEEVAGHFQAAFPYGEELCIFSPDRSTRLDLAEANRRQLISAGLEPSAITMTRECTQCDTKRFFSYRAEKGWTGRMMAVIGRRV